MPGLESLPLLAEPEVVADTRCETGEGPLWHPDEQRLYWTDIPGGRLYRLDPATGTYEEVYAGDQVGGTTLQADGALLLLGARGAVRVWRDGQVVRTIHEDLPAERDTRFNDVIADPEGRVFGGTMAIKDTSGRVTRPGRLYRIDLDGTLTTVLEEVVTPNGMGFTPDGRQMYFTETGAGIQTIYRFDYDRTTGAIANQRPFLQTPLDGSEGRPDGMTVDADGCVWSARWDGGVAVRLAPDGTPLGVIRFPARKVSSLTFGGADYTDLYVTTAGGPNRDREGAGAGALFHARVPGVRGVPEFRSRVGLPRVTGFGGQVPEGLSRDRNP